MKKMISLQLRRNMVSGVVLTTGNAVLNLISYPIYLHFLGYERYGVWLILAAVLTFIQMGGNLGIETALRKLVAEESGRDNLSSIQSYLVMALLILMFTGGLGLLLILSFKSSLVALFNLSGENGVLAFQLLPYVGLLCLYAFVARIFNAVLGGLGRMDQANLIFLLGQAALMTTSIILLYRGADIHALLIGQVVFYVVIHVTSYLAVRRLLPLRLWRRRNLDWRRGRKLVRFGSGIVAGSLLGMMIMPFNKLMLSRYVGPATLPVYEITCRGATLIRNLVEAAFRALTPEISRLEAEKNARARHRIAGIYRRSFRMLATLGIPLFALLMIGAEVLFRLLLRKDFVVELPGIFRLMLVATFLSLLGVPAYYTLIGLGRIRHIMISHSIVSLANIFIVLGAVLLHAALSVYTIAWAMVVGMGIASTYVLWQNNRHLPKNKIRLQPFYMLSPEAINIGETPHV